MEACYAQGVTTGPARWVGGCPVRFSFGGARGFWSLVMTPEPATWHFWRAAAKNRRNVKFCDLSAAGKPADSLPQRAKQPSSSGATVASSSTSGSPWELPAFWSSETMGQPNVGPSFSAPQAEEKYEQIR